MASAAEVLKMIKDNDIKFVDLRFTDTRGKEQHTSVPAKVFDSSKFEDGHAFDGSSISGWKGIQASDMLLMPDPASARPRRSSAGKAGATATSKRASRSAACGARRALKSAAQPAA